MANFLAGKRILLGITGSIAAYKSADLARRLRDSGAIVRVAMTENAKRFITPLTMQAVSGHPIHDDLFDLQAEAAMGHIELARWADLVLIAPATADCMTRLVQGNANDLLTTLCLATKAPIAIAPAMNQGMWHHTMTQENQQVLRKKNIHIFGPAAGSQACGEVGFGRMLEPTEIVEKASELFATGALSGVRILITAGPTHEPIDPVRYLTNGSSGKMGYALAQSAQEAGAAVTIISGPVSVPIPTWMGPIFVKTAQEMHDIVMKKIADHDIFLAVAAVSDYRAETISAQKIHKKNDVMELKFIRNPDIVASVGALKNPPFIVGFAAETDNVIANAKAKKSRKNMQMIVANRVDVGVGIGTDDNELTVITNDSETILPRDSKEKLARQLIEMISKEFKNFSTKRQKI